MTKDTGKLIDEDGAIRHGFHTAPVGLVNYRDYRLRSPLRDILPTAERDRRFVHFHFMGFVSAGYYSGCSLTLASGVPTLFFYLYNRQTGNLLKRGVRLAAADADRISRNPDHGITELSGNGLTARFSCAGPEKSLSITLDGNDLLDVSFQDGAPAFDALRLVTPTGPNGWTYCQKVAGVPARGWLKQGGETTDLGANDAFAHHDFTAGFLRPDTFWNWACLTGRGGLGQAIGLNVSNGVNETGYSENAVWLDGRRFPLPQVMFHHDLDNLMRPWTVSSSGGEITLTFTPEGQYAARNGDIETPFDFNQLFGTFNGHVTLPGGDKIDIHALPGFCERQYAIWWI
ncbi:DUF2804 domain-containing protein [Sneathiella chinensis]|uniref:AttH domain-containing protein n=1 Tax=Sneathiella chinensis TaxID=349750 RepID=A0ABQ5U2I8_9PROT|nr:DUF2804 domain-containing protein [Sneathiella chinensis]GLQ05547.1 hypothetical protein GCM10007924_07680 [Sneathiella chinensis]